jgi:TPR repeat protein
MYAKGQGVEKDIHTALKYYKKAAELGDSLAYTDIGWCYESGELGEPNLDMAVQFYQLAAMAGEPHAKEALKRLGISEQDNHFDIP